MYKSKPGGIGTPLRRLRPLFIGLLALFVWELLYLLGLLSPRVLSHPVGILRTFGDWEFLIRLTGIAIVFTVAFALGGVAGLGLGAVVLRSTWIAAGAHRFLRLGRWFPLFTAWALPIWPLETGRELAPFFLTLAVGVVTVALSISFCYLEAAGSDGLTRGERWLLLLQSAVAQALLVSLLGQMWMSRWEWLFTTQDAGIERGYALVLFLMVVISLVESRCGLGLSEPPGWQRGVILKQLREASWRSMLGAGTVGIVLLLIWQILSLSGLDSVLGSPLNVLASVYALLVLGTELPKMDWPIWWDIAISVFEVAMGLVLAGGLVLLVQKGIPIARTSGLPHVTHIVPILLPLFLTHWGQAIWGTPAAVRPMVMPLQTAITVGVFALYPFFETFRMLHGCPMLCRVVIAVDGALPYAFIAALFGESWTATSGLGFYMTMARHVTFSVTEGLAASLIAVVLLVLVSSSLRRIARSSCFQN